MRNISEKDLQYQEKKWERQKGLLTRKKKIDDEKMAFKLSYLPKIQTTKILMAFLFINCSIVEVFTGYVTMKSFELAQITGNSPDLTPLVSLIGAVVSEVIGFAIYSIKSTKENTKGGIVFENAMRSFNSSDESPADEEING